MTNHHAPLSTDVQRVCAAPDCENAFTGRLDKRFCCYDCKHRTNNRRRAQCACGNEMSRQAKRCRSCLFAEKRAAIDELRSRGLARCSRCKQDLPVDQFRSEKNARGLAAYCHDCALEYARGRGGEVKRKQHLTRYGLVPEEYDALFAQQDERCAICRLPSHHKRHKHLSVDHDHKTGAVRGLLCHSCNVVLGMARDDVTVLRAAIDYLTR